MEPEELREEIKDKLKLNVNNGNPQKIIPIRDLRKYIEDGCEYIRGSWRQESHSQIT